MNLLRKLSVGLSALAVVVMPLKALAVETVQLETQTHVANVTGGVAPSYQKAVSAKTDDVVRAEVYYHNREAANSGKVAQNLTVKINVLETSGAVPVTGTVSADNAAATVTDTATVNLVDANSRLQYIPGTAKWRHNIGTNEAPNFVTQSISDSIVNGNGLRLENEQPCFNFEATVIAEFRVVTPNISIVKQVKVDGSTDKYAVVNTAKAGDTLSYVFVVKNLGNTKLYGVQVGDILPAHVTYVPNSTRLVDSITGIAGVNVTDDRITQGGVTVDNLEVGGSETIYFKAKVDAETAMPCGVTTIKNAGFAKATGVAQLVNYATTTVNKVCVTVTPPPVTPPVVTPPPVTPPALPATGAEGALVGMFGTAGIGYSLRSYLRSKRNLLSSLKR